MCVCGWGGVNENALRAFWKGGTPGDYGGAMVHWRIGLILHRSIVR